MIVILCSSFKAACRAFDIFLQLLDDNEPWSIQKVFYGEKCIELEDDLRYIFIDHRFVHAFDKMHPDIVDVQAFFAELNELYYPDEEIDYYDL